MNSDLTTLLLLAGAFLALFGIAELLYHKAGVRAEYTRKIVHAGTGMLTLLFPLLLDHFWQVVMLCGSFLVLLLASRKWGWLPSINAVQRDTLGSLLYPIIVALVFLFYRHSEEKLAPFSALAFFYLPILIMAICDPVAAAVGQSISANKPQLRGRKTWQGSAAFFVGAGVLACALTAGPSLCGSEDLSVGVARVFVLAISTTLAERWSTRGWDNFTIPATAAAVLWAFERVSAWAG